MSMTRIAVLASGGGSNLQAILDHLHALGPARPGEVQLVISNRADAGALERGRARGITSLVVDGAGLLPTLSDHSIDMVALAGYVRMVPSDVTDAYAGRIVNVHPALLPAFGGAGMYGRRVHEAVLSRGVRVTGVTVHMVDSEYDQGAIVAQWPVPVLAGDDVDILAARVLEAEHRLYPRVVAALAAGRVRLGANGRVEGDWAPLADSHFAMVARAMFLSSGVPGGPSGEKRVG